MTDQDTAAAEINDSFSLRGDVAHPEAATPYMGEPLPAPDPFYIERDNAEVRERAFHAALHPALSEVDPSIEGALDRAAKILAFIKGE